MNKPVKLTTVLTIMVLSMTLLTGFVGYWLWQQYRNEKQLLVGQLQQAMAETQRQAVDSLLFKRFILPLMADSGKNTIRFTPHHDSLVGLPETEEVSNFEQQINLSPNTKSKNTRNIRLELNVTDSSFKSAAKLHQGKMKRSFTFVSDGKTRSDSATEIIANSNGETRISKIKGDTNNLFLMQGMRLVLSEIAGAANMELNSKAFIEADSALIKKLFNENLQKAKLQFVVNWFPVKKDSLKAKSGELHLSTTMFAKNYRVEVLNTNWYLIKRLQSQFWFVFFMLGITAFAFVMAYRNLARQLRLNQIKNDLINNMSHELKTPVATVKVALEALQDKRVLNNEQVVAEYLNMATLELNRLELLMTKVLNSSLLDYQESFYELSAVNLNELVQETVGALQLRAEKQGASISVDLPLEPVFVNADKIHTQGVLLNLLDNALKYGGKQPQILVKLTNNNENISLSVADNGPGVPTAYLTKVFDKFFRVPSGNVHNTKGFGLGLSYAQQVMKQQGGTISVSNLPESGCQFTLLFSKQYEG